MMTMKPEIADEAAKAKWPEDLLNEMTRTADPPADEMVSLLFRTGGVQEVNAFWTHLVRNDDPIPPNASDELRKYFQQSAVLPAWAQPDLIRRAEAFFEENGPFCLIALLCASLPECYVLKDEAAVLATTGQLGQHAYRRIFETTQLVVAVMHKDGLGPGGTGIRAAQKVRLMHAAIRHLILNPPPDTSPGQPPQSFPEAMAKREPWNLHAAGQPINQEQIAYTLLTFSYVTLRALEDLKIPVEDADREAFTHCWNIVGSLMGLRPELLAGTFADQARLFARVRERRMAASEDGRRLARALVKNSRDIIQHETGGFIPRLIIKRLPAVIIRMVTGRATRKALRLRMWGPFEWLLLILFRTLVLISRPGYQWLLTFAGSRFAEAIILRLTKIQRGNRPLFTLPNHLATAWRRK